MAPSRASMQFTEGRRNVLIKARAKTGSLRTGAESGPIFWEALRMREQNQMPPLQGILLPGTGRSMVGIALMLPAGERMMPRSLCASLDLAWAWR